MPLDFPNSPAPNQVFSDASGASWFWDGAKWSAMGSTTAGWPFLPLTGGTVDFLAVNGSTNDPNITVNTALFTGTGAGYAPGWFPATSVWVPNGGLQVKQPFPYGAGGLACAAFISIGTPADRVPPVQGGLIDVGATDLARYPGRDQVVLATQALDVGPLLVLNNVTYDTTHLRPATPLTTAQIAQIKPNMIIDTNHTPKFSGLVTGVATDGTSITVSAWYQTVGGYVSSATVAAGGTGYHVGSVSEAMSLPSATCATVTVTSVDGGGAITGVAVSYGGSYFPGGYWPAIDPALSYPLYGGGGSGASVHLTTTAVAANTAAGQNPQSVPLHGTAPPAFKAFVNPAYKTWNRNSVGFIGSNAGVVPWTPPYVEGGGLVAVSGEEMDLGNFTGVYIPGHDGMDGDYPQIRGFEITNSGNARCSIGIEIIGDWQNGFSSYNAAAGTAAFGVYNDAWGYTFKVDPDGPVQLGGHRQSRPCPIQWHTTNSTQIDAQIQALGGTTGTPYGATLHATTAALQVEPSATGNNLLLAGAAAGSGPTISVSGVDATVALQLQASGGIHAMSGLFAGAGLWATNNTAGNVPPAISGGISGGGFTWNYIGGSSELDYWNGWIGAVLSHTFWQHTGGAPIRLMDIGPTGSVRAYGGVNNTPIGNTTPAPGSFTTLSTSGNAYVGGGGGSWLVISQVGQGTDQNLWNIGSAAGGTLTMQAANDPFNNGTTWLTVTRTGFVPQAITLTAPSIVHAGVTVISAAGGPTIRAGPGAATGTQPKGSLWLRTDGAAGSTLYVTQGAGTWAAVAGV